MALYLMSSPAPSKTLLTSKKITPIISTRYQHTTEGSSSLLCGNKFQNSERMSHSHERDADPHSLFQISQNLNLEQAARDRAEQRLRELGGGNVHVPPPTVLVTPSKKRARDADLSEDPAGSQPASNDRKKRRIHKKRPRAPFVIPENVEIISVSSGSENGNSPLNLDATKQHERRRRIYHPDNHTSTCWRCPVRTCRRHNPEFGFRTNEFVERHIRNRHLDELIYPCISGCSISFRDGRAWERHHRVFHADEISQ